MGPKNGEGSRLIVEGFRFEGKPFSMKSWPRPSIMHHFIRSNFSTRELYIKNGEERISSGFWYERNTVQYGFLIYIVCTHVAITEIR